MEANEDAVTDRLRARGLRVTPQRRVILEAFTGGRTEHLSAEEVHERARRALPELARATVYNTLNELVRAGLLGVFGRPEPVRYELHREPHQHFRCLACRRLYDVFPETTRRFPAPDDGFVIERVQVLFEGTCGQCAELERALRDARAQDVPREPLAGRVELAHAAIESPLGPMLAATSEQGLVCLAFGGERPEPILRDLVERLGADLVEAPDRLAAVDAQVSEFFAGGRRAFDLPVDLSSVRRLHRQALEAIAQVPYGEVVDYRHVTDALDSPEAGRVAGQALGANPLAIVVPCHRVMRADGGLGGYVGGEERKQALLALEGSLR